MSDPFVPRAPRILVTGSAGFVGYHLCARLLAQGAQVTGLDAFTDYYDVALKRARHARLAGPGFTEAEGRVETPGLIEDLVARLRPEIVVHLAGQAGVRHSIDAPETYLDANITGSFRLLEALRRHPCRHLMFASSSSVYGAEAQMPYAEAMGANAPMSFYAATKKAGEAMAHSYAHLYGIPSTMFRFFTVYGPWGRPDMALFKFTSAILDDAPIDVYNHGDMRRDFTFVEDLVEGLVRLADAPPAPPRARGEPVAQDSLSPVAPWRVVNLGHGAPQRLGDFIAAIEAATGRRARRNALPMQPGDVPATWADTRLQEALIGPLPKTPLDEGVARFVAWYRAHYGV
ncbi:NAD-dependent epimerase/dehydratase family protein [Limimaricola cinnabarinus]|uniref:NAD-dependent epimerase/dehydratase family protein n=1 Tax=Limimaricola cinnabarinus TaxID=1125964 RepID=UPI0024919B8F|nr:NAD-dependent epimerase/dehydratase family protein [Limimaricola cinnabarinus]